MPFKFGIIFILLQDIRFIIRELKKIDSKFYGKGVEGGALLYPLHSSLNMAKQIAIFEVPPPGKRKIVIATNIAETR